MISEKLQKILARAGYGSRRELERWITEGRVTINGQVATTGDRASTEDAILVDGKPVYLPAHQRVRVILYNSLRGRFALGLTPKVEKLFLIAFLG